MFYALFFILVGLVNIFVYYGKVNLIKDPKINALFFSQKVKLLFFLCGVTLTFFGVILFSLNVYEIYFL